MKLSENKGFDPSVITDYRARIKLTGDRFLRSSLDENNDEYVHFYFIGRWEGREVIYDAVMYTLRLEHESELFEIAEHRAAKHFPSYKKITYPEDEDGNFQPLDELEEEIGLFIAETIMELEDEDQVKVKEHADLDLNIEFGIGLEVGLHLEKINTAAIEQFIKEFKDDTLSLDSTLYSFQAEDEESGG